MGKLTANPTQTGGVQAQGQATPLLDELFQDMPQAGATPPQNLGPSPVAEQAQASPEMIYQQLEQERIPDIKERLLDQDTVYRWKPLEGHKPITSKADGGLMDRAKRFSDITSNPEAQLKVSMNPSQRDAEGTIIKPRPLGDLFETMQVSYNTPSVNPEGIQLNQYALNPKFASIASIIVENKVAELGEGTNALTQNKDTGEWYDTSRNDVAMPTDLAPDSPISRKNFPAAEGNESLGRQIYDEWMRYKTNQEGTAIEPPPISQKDAALLGASMKELWAEANPELITRLPGSQNRDAVYNLTAEGMDTLTKSAGMRKRLLPKQHVRTSKVPLPQGELLGERKKIVKAISGQKGKQHGQELLKEAMTNLSNVPNVVDKQRMRILFSTILPALSQNQDVDPALMELYGNINNIGLDKLQEFEAKAKSDPTVNPQEELQNLQETVAQQIFGIATERNGANYLSYYIQAFNGRIAPQQTHFDPTTSKAVRFVTRNATPAEARPGNRVDHNLQQMYAMMLLPKDMKADMLLPKERVRALASQTKQLVAWGERLQQVLDESMTNEQAEAVAQAIQDGMSLSDPNFPQFKGFQLDPEKDADLIKHIASKGEDGPHVIDGLIDYAKYHKAVRVNGQPYRSFFNAYIDGKTNGIASNGIQMGSKEVALATGVIRNQEKTLLDEGDIRDKLQENLLRAVDEIGFSGTTEIPEIYDLARNLFSVRNLNKATTMTFGYGKELNSFKKDIAEFLDQIRVKDPAVESAYESVTRADGGLDRKTLIEALHKMYVGALVEALSDDAIKSRGVMRAAAINFAIMDKLFKIRSPIGFELAFGGMELDKDTVESQRYSITRPDMAASGREVFTGERKATSAAARADQGPGKYAYGGSVPGPVQSIDAATVALSASGKTWKRLSAASGGNPYLHTIYDAFKLDANGFDVMVEEINNNWLNASMDWSYLKETRHAVDKAVNQWFEEYKTKDPNAVVDAGPGGEAQMVGDLLTMDEGDNGPYLKRLNNLLGKIMDLPEGEEGSQVKRAALNDIEQQMREAGWKPQNRAEYAVQEFEITQEFLDHLEEKVRTNYEPGRDPDNVRMMHTNELVEYYLIKSGQVEGNFGEGFAGYDYKDKNGVKVDIKAVPAGRNHINSNDQQIATKARTPAEKKADVIEIWERLDNIEGPPTLGQKIKFRPVGRINNDALYAQADKKKKGIQQLKFDREMMDGTPVGSFDPSQLSTLTNKQVYVFLRALNQHTKLRARLDDMIKRTEHNKKELKKEILKGGPVLQYYAH